MIRAVTFTNYLGDSIRLDLARPEESGFIIKSVTGLGPGKANINTTEIATNDGSLFNSSRMPSRNIVISLAYMWKDSIEDVRQLSYKYFPIKKKLTMLIETDNRQAEIEGYVESNDPTIFSKDEGLLDYIKQDYYLQSKESEHVMIVEKIQITSDTEDGNHVTVTGRSLESILDRRIVWGQKLLSGNLQNGIKTLLNENVISPSDSNRKIPNFIFKESTDPAITKLKLEAQYTGDNLYDVIQKICEEQGIGFKITLNDEKQFVFELYAGSDRSYDQTENPYVIFSPKFENIINSNYIESKASLKTVTLVGGEGEGADRRYTTVGGGSGLNRRELFTDARDISSNVGSDDALTDAEYMAQLQQRGKEKLAENVSITSFEGETETTIMFQYGKDFFNGDIVQIANEYGHETKARILEIVRSEDKDGYSVYPTFKTIEQEGA